MKLLYWLILSTFTLYLLLLNTFVFLTSQNYKQLFTPFHIKERTIALYNYFEYITLITGVAPANTPTSEIQAKIKDYSYRYGLNEEIINLIAQTESKYNQFAISQAGAIGIMQLMPNTFDELASKTLSNNNQQSNSQSSNSVVQQSDKPRPLNPFDINDNLLFGIQYFNQQLHHFKSLPLALSAYNAGPGTVRRSNTFSKIPNYAETQNYVYNIIQQYKAYEQDNLHKKNKINSIKIMYDVKSGKNDK